MSSLRIEITKIWINTRASTADRADPLPLVCEQSPCYLVRNGQSNFEILPHFQRLTRCSTMGLFDAAFRLASRPRVKQQKRPTEAQALDASLWHRRP